MDVFTWVCQIVLAIVFLGSGVAKTTMSRERLLATGQTGAAAFPMPIVRFTAATELLAGAGLLLPWATGVARALTPAAALGLVIIMIVAAITHWRLEEPRNVHGNGVLIALCLIVIVVRTGQL